MIFRLIKIFVYKTFEFQECYTVFYFLTKKRCLISPVIVGDFSETFSKIQDFRKKANF